MLKKGIFILPGVVLLCGFGVLIFDRKALAQVIPDNTLPINSIVTPNKNTLIINGGTVAGNNLFHSFEQFTIPTGNSAYFNNASNIQNIFSRVTGSSVSNIDGAIKANGTANLFLLNPNGIIFGPNASLNIGGSFIGSTANHLLFSDGSKFSATEPQATPLLTINAPIGLAFGLTPGQISVNGDGHELRVADPTIAVGSPIVGSSENSTGLRTAFGKTLALIGGQVMLDGGILTAPSGQIQIGSITGGTVNLSSTPTGFSFDYDNINNFGDIQLSNKALIDASGILSGQIVTQSKNIYLNDGSLILISNFGDQTFGKINIKATDSVVLTGVSDPILFDPFSLGVTITKGILSQNLSILKGADIDISSRNLIIQSNGGIASTTFNEGIGGNITLKVSDSLRIMGNPPISLLFLPSGIGSLALSSGQSGNIELSGKSLFIKDGGLIITQTFGSAKGGDVIADFSEGIEISGGFPINLASNSFIPSTLGTLSTSDGNAGNILLNTRQLRIEDGGRINATTAASGSAGNIIINTTDFVKVAGRIPNSSGNALYNLSQIVSSATQNNSFLVQFLNLPNLPQGVAGDIKIDTNNLIIQNEGQVSVINEGTGDAGEIKIGSSSIFLDTKGSITASSQSGQGGNIEINSKDLLLMRHNSQISTSAGNTQAGGDGGQININTSFVVAPPLENSDITANAFEGRGGNIKIAAQGIFGIESRTRLTPLSDITASSALGINGTVQINTLDTNPTNGLVSLPPTVVDNSRLVAQDCSAREDSLARGRSKFIISGRGGLPPQPGDPLRAEATVFGQDTLKDREENHLEKVMAVLPARSTPTQIVEAQGWIINNQGQVVLTAQPPNVTPYSSRSTQVTCYAP